MPATDLPVPMNDLGRIVSGGSHDAIEAATRALRSGWWLNGGETRGFCEAFADYVGVEHCTGVANGTDALEIAIRALLETGRARGSEVVTVANAGGYTSIAARLIGLTPVYADIDEASQLLDVASAVSALSDETALVVATHLYGGMVDVPALRAAMDGAGHGRVPILEDCAQAHGLRRGERMAGALGDVATFSFYPTKNLGAFGDGGAIATSDADLLAACDALRQYGWTSKYTVAMPNGRNSRLDEVQAAILRQLLPGLDAANARRVEILSAYEAAAPEGVRVVRAVETVGHLAVLLVEDRDALRAHLEAQGVRTDVHYPVLDCDQPGWSDLPQRLAPGGVPVSRTSVPRLLSLPCFPTLRDDELERVCEALSAWRA